MTAAGLLAIVGTIVTAAALVGGAFGVLKANLAKATAETYRADNEALRARLDTVEGENHRLNRDVQDLTGTVAALREERNVLRDLATGASAVARLEEHLDERLAVLESLLRRHTDDRRTHPEEQP